jgi:outer membrane protein assembly factor BamB
MNTVWVATQDDTIEAPLASDGSRVFVTTRAGTIQALGDAGEAAWSIRGPAGLLSAAPGILVVRQPDGTVRSLDPETGATRWEAPAVPGTLPAVIDDGRVIVAGTGLTELDADTGRVLWTAADGPECLAPPAAARSVLVTTERDGVVSARDRITGRALWRYRAAAAVVAAADAQRAYVGTTDRRVLALDLRKGTLEWRWKVGADVSMRPALLGGRVLVASLEAVLHALGAGNGHLAWRAPLASRPFSGPLLVGDSVLVASHENELQGFDGRTGRSLGSLRVPAEMRTQPLIARNRVHVGLRDRSVVALALDLTPAKAVPSPRATPRSGRRQR